jgi:hypothetical protein
MAHNKMLHLYLHPRQSRSATVYKNRWLSDSKPESIETYEAVRRHCQLAMENGRAVRIHRRKGDGFPAAVICCECKVKSISPEGNDGTRFRVYFHEYRPLDIPMEKFLQKGWYLADPASYETSN